VLDNTPEFLSFVLLRMGTSLEDSVMTFVLLNTYLAIPQAKFNQRYSENTNYWINLYDKLSQFKPTDTNLPLSNTEKEELIKILKKYYIHEPSVATQTELGTMQSLYIKYYMYTGKIIFLIMTEMSKDLKNLNGEHFINIYMIAVHLKDYYRNQNEKELIKKLFPQDVYWNDLAIQIQNDVNSQNAFHVFPALSDTENSQLKTSLDNYFIKSSVSSEDLHKIKALLKKAILHKVSSPKSSMVSGSGASAGGASGSGASTGGASAGGASVGGASGSGASTGGASAGGAASSLGKIMDERTYLLNTYLAIPQARVNQRYIENIDYWGDLYDKVKQFKPTDTYFALSSSEKNQLIDILKKHYIYEPSVATETELGTMKSLLIKDFWYIRKLSPSIYIGFSEDDMQQNPVNTFLIYIVARYLTDHVDKSEIDISKDYLFPNEHWINFLSQIHNDINAQNALHVFPDLLNTEKDELKKMLNNFLNSFKSSISSFSESDRNKLEALLKKAILHKLSSPKSSIIIPFKIDEKTMMFVVAVIDSIVPFEKTKIQEQINNDLVFWNPLVEKCSTNYTELLAKPNLTSEQEIELSKLLSNYFQFAGITTSANKARLTELFQKKLLQYDSKSNHTDSKTDIANKSYNITQTTAPSQPSIPSVPVKSKADLLLASKDSNWNTADQLPFPKQFNRHSSLMIRDFVIYFLFANWILGGILLFLFFRKWGGISSTKTIVTFFFGFYGWILYTY
jgi:hypothetical protein